MNSNLRKTDLGLHLIEVVMIVIDTSIINLKVNFNFVILLLAYPTVETI